jgi:hypothetical protein
MKIPEIRDELTSIADNLDKVADRLTQLCIELHRRPAVRKARASSKPLDKAVAAAIRQTAARHPGWSYHDIAEHYNVNIGRVSEVLRGKRK